MSKIECEVTGKQCSWKPEGNCGACFDNQPQMQLALLKQLQTIYPDLKPERLIRIPSILNHQLAVFNIRVSGISESTCEVINGRIIKD